MTKTIDMTEIIKRYEAGESSTILAKALGVAPSTLCNRLARAGLKLRGKGPNPVFDEAKLSKLIEMYKAGDKLVYIAAVLGVSVTSCSIHLRMYRDRCKTAHRQVLVDLLDRLRGSMKACHDALALGNIDKTTAKKYRESVTRFEAQIAALESVT